MGLFFENGICFVVCLFLVFTAWLLMWVVWFAFCELSVFLVWFVLLFGALGCFFFLQLS